MVANSSESHATWNQKLAAMPGSLKWASLAVGLLVVGWILNQTGTGRGSLKSLFGEARLELAELRRTQVALARAGITSAEIRNAQVWVPEAQVAQSLKALDQQGALPRALRAPTAEPPTISPFLSRYQQQLQLQFQKKTAVQELLRSLNFVADASVEIELTGPAERGSTGRTQCTAAILPRDQQPLGPSQLETIRQILVGSIGNLDRETTVIVDLAVGIAYNHDLMSGDQTHLQNAAIERIRASQFLEQSVRRALADLPGLTVSVIYAECPTALLPTENQTAATGMLPSHTSIPGSNGGAAVSLPTTHLAGSSESHPPSIPLVNIRLDPNLPLASAYPDFDPQQLKSEIISRVRPLLPDQAFEGGNGRLPIVVDLPGVDPASPSSTRTLGNLITSAPGGLWIALASTICLALVFLGSFRRKTAAPISPSEPDSPRFVEVEDRQAELQQQIDQLLRQNPDTAANVIREWIQKAA